MLLLVVVVVKVAVALSLALAHSYRCVVNSSREHKKKHAKNKMQSQTCDKNGIKLECNRQNTELIVSVRSIYRH